jgi:hypothetical protein
MVKIGQEGSTAVTSSEEKAALAELGKAGQDQRSAAEFLPALWAETERDLAAIRSGSRGGTRARCRTIGIARAGGSSGDRSRG